MYRSRDGVILGVCRGIAEYFDFSVFWVRAVAASALILSGLWPVTALYCIAALLMKPEPVRPILSEEEQEFYDGYLSSRKRVYQRLKTKHDGLERRIQRMEDTVTAREFDWDQRLKA